MPIIATFAVVYIVCSVLFFLEYRKNHTHERIHAFTVYDDASQTYIEGRCGRIPYLLVNECSLEDVNAEQAERREIADLKAQQEMSEWALFLALLGPPGLLVSSFGLAALIWTFTEQRKLFHNQERAVLEVEDGAFWPIMRHSTPHMHADVLIKNTGRTHAKNIHLKGELTWHPGEELITDDDLDPFGDIKLELKGEIVKEAASGYRGEIPPGEFDVIVSFQETNIDVSPLRDAHQKWGSGGPNMMGAGAHLGFSGTIEYRDVFDVLHSVSFYLTWYTTSGGAPYYAGSGGARHWRTDQYKMKRRLTEMRYNRNAEKLAKEEG